MIKIVEPLHLNHLIGFEVGQSSEEICLHNHILLQRFIEEVWDVPLKTNLHTMGSKY